MGFSTLIILSYCAALLIVIAAVIYIVLKLSKKSTFARSAVFLVITFILAFLMWSFINFDLNGQAPWYSNLGNALSKSIKSYAMANGPEALFDASLYPSTVCYNMTLFLINYAAQISMFGIVSVAVITNLFKAYLRKRINFISLFFSIFKRRGESSYNYSINIVYTNLDYDSLAPFIENLKKDNKAQIKMVVLKTYAATQNGSELIERLKMEGYDTFTEGLDPYAMSKLCGFGRNMTINFYGMFYEDKDNLEFAKAGYSFLKKHKKGIAMNNRGNVHFYVSYQDIEFSSKFSFVNDCKDAIKLVNEYDWVATKFVFQNPLTRLVKINPDNFQNELEKIDNIHFHFLGCGRVSSSLLDKIFSNYQLPANEEKLTFNLVDKNAVDDDFATNFLGKYQVFSSVYADKKKFLEQKNARSNFINYQIDVTNEDELNKYAKEIIDNLVKHKNEDDLSKAKHFIFISLGDEITNANVAMKLRRSIINFSELEGGVLSKESRYKSVIIYPYIKSNHFFKQNITNFESATGELLEENHIDSKEAVVNMLGDYDIYTNKVKQMIGTSGKYQLKDKYEENLSFVFENKYSRPLPYIRLFVLQRIVINISNSTKTRKLNKQIATLAESMALKQKTILSIHDNSSLSDNIKDYKIGELTASLQTMEEEYNHLVLLKKYNEVFAYPKLYFFPWNKKKYDLEKDYASAVKELAFSNFRKAKFIMEDCPIVVFGRGGYVSDQLRSSIEYLAKIVNITYLGEKYKDAKPRMNKEWDSLSYSLKQSNFGTCLSLPYRLHLLGYELDIDKNQAIMAYFLSSNKDKESLKKIYDIRYRGYISCVDEYAKGNNMTSSLYKICSISDSLNDAINNKPYFLSLLSNKLRKEIEIKKEFSLRDVKESFDKVYQLTYQSYLEQKPNKDGVYKVNDDLVNMLMDYYAVVYLARTNEKLFSLRNIEHNRWYIDSGSRGIVPLPMTAINYKFDNRSSDRIRNYCMTTCSGLDDIVKLTLLEMLKTGNVFMISDKSGRGDYSNFDFDYKDKTHYYFNRIFSKTFESDILAFKSLLSFLGSEIPEMSYKSNELPHIKNKVERKHEEFSLTTRNVYVVRKRSK